MNIVVQRKGTIWFNDYYEVDEINDKTIQECINDNSYCFLESSLEWDTWDPDGEYVVINCDTDEILAESEKN